MFERLRRSFPADPRLVATRETTQTWERLVQIDKAIGTVRTTVSTTASAATALARVAIRLAAPDSAEHGSADQGSGSSGSAPSKDQRADERASIRATNEWAGPASLAVGPTSGELAVGQPRWRRALRPDLVVGWPEGWLRVTPVSLQFTPIRQRRGRGRAGRDGHIVTTEMIELTHDDLVDLELVPLGRRTAGVTAVSSAGDELWILVDDRRKLDEMASRLRYRDRS